MKKYMSLLLALVLVLSLAACGGGDKEEAQQEQQKEVQQSPEAVPESAEPQQPAEEASAIDYDLTPFEDWAYMSDAEEGPAALLTGINTVPYGSAGASLKEMIAATKMVELSADPEAIQAVTDFLGEMTPLQKDYFSFSWDMVSIPAKSLFTNFEAMQPGLADAGLESCDIALYNEADFDALDEAVRNLLTEQGVTEEWQNHMDIAPFMSAN